MTQPNAGPLRAYHGDPARKATYLDRVRRHRDADELVQRIGWKNGRGCAVGCTLDAYDHAQYPTELGVPLMLAHLEDQIFEGLPTDEALGWPERFLAAIPVGADLSHVGPTVLLAIVARRREALATLTISESLRGTISAALRAVEAVLAQWIETGRPDASAAGSAMSAARSAAESAWSAGESAAWSTAWSAASAASAGESAMSAMSAMSAARSAAWSAGSAWSAAEYRWLADTLCDAMAGAPIHA